ncbi:MAG: TIM barrel protein [Deltaproteobacteria bacterium]|nr:TIM barrel protein [Deltaproteobacteria bacterium]
MLAYVESCLPGAMREERVALARRLELALEIAHEPGFDPAWWQRPGMPPIASLQAFGMHDAHPLHEDAERRAQAVTYLEQALQAASKLGVPRLIVACGFGKCVVDRPFDRCFEFFGAMASTARDLGLRLLIEPLSPLRAEAMNDPGDIERLLDALDAPDVFGTVLDTGHLVDGGHDPTAILRRWCHRVDELQLRGAGGRPPSPDLPLREWLGALAAPPDVLAVEHRVATTASEVERLVDDLRVRPWSAGGGWT